MPLKSLKTAARQFRSQGSAGRNALNAEQLFAEYLATAKGKLDAYKEPIKELIGAYMFERSMAKKDKRDASWKTYLGLFHTEEALSFLQQVAKIYAKGTNKDVDIPESVVNLMGEPDHADSAGLVAIETSKASAFNGMVVPTDPDTGDVRISEDCWTDVLKQFDPTATGKKENVPCKEARDIIGLRVTFEEVRRVTGAKMQWLKSEPRDSGVCVGWIGVEKSATPWAFAVACFFRVFLLMSFRVKDEAYAADHETAIQVLPGYVRVVKVKAGSAMWPNFKRAFFCVPLFFFRAYGAKMKPSMRVNKVTLAKVIGAEYAQAATAAEHFLPNSTLPVKCVSESRVQYDVAGMAWVLATLVYDNVKVLSLSGTNLVRLAKAVYSDEDLRGQVSFVNEKIANHHDLTLAMLTAAPVPPLRAGSEEDDKVFYGETKVAEDSKEEKKEAKEVKSDAKSKPGKGGKKKNGANTSDQTPDANPEMGDA